MLLQSIRARVLIIALVALVLGALNSCGKNAHVTGADFPLLDQPLEGPEPSPSSSQGPPSDSDDDSDSSDGDDDGDNHPTPSPTSTATPTHSPSVTPTHSPSVTPTHSPSVTPTHSPSVTPTHSPTVTPTSSPTVTPTSSPTVTPTSSPTVTPSPAPSHCVYKKKKKTFKAVHHALFSKKVESKIEFPEPKYFGELLHAELKTESFKYEVTASLDKAVWKHFYCEAKPIGNHQVKGELEFKWKPLEPCHGDLTLTLTWTELVCSGL